MTNKAVPYPASPTRVKICCISSTEEARLAVAAGASALGLVSEMPSGPGVVSLDVIAGIAAGVPPGADTFLLTCKDDLETLAGQIARARVTTVQLVDTVDFAVLARLRALFPYLRLVQVIHVCGKESIDEALTAEPHVDALLLDSGNPQAVVKELGGTGRVHDWTISRRIVECVAKPVFLAGGLTPDNVADAIREVRPYGLDVCSGVRSDQKLDPVKLRTFFSVVRGVFAESGGMV